MSNRDVRAYRPARHAVLGLLFSLVVIAACSTSQPATTGAGARPAAATPASVSPSSDPDAARCAASGGALKAVCMSRTLRCVTLYEDAGRRCADKSDCKGHCLYDRRSSEAAGFIVGRCQADDDPCGCFAYVIKGQLSGSLCVD